MAFMAQVGNVAGVVHFMYLAYWSVTGSTAPSFVTRLAPASPSVYRGRISRDFDNFQQFKIVKKLWKRTALSMHDSMIEFGKSTTFYDLLNFKLHTVDYTCV